MINTERAEQRRVGDSGFMCLLALRASQLWDFVDQRDIDKHAMAWATFGITCYILQWSLNFVWVYPDKPGLEVAAVVGAIMITWTPVQAAVIKWYFESRSDVSLLK